MENYTDQIYHHGVKGMRWGHRKARPTVSRQERYAYRRKEYNKAFNKLNKRSTHLNKKELSLANKLAKKYNTGIMNVRLNDTYGMNKAQKKQYAQDRKEFDKVARAALKANTKDSWEAGKIAKQKTIEKYGKSKASTVLKAAAGVAAIAVGTQVVGKNIAYQVGKK